MNHPVRHRESRGPVDCDRPSGRPASIAVGAVVALAIGLAIAVDPVAGALQEQSIERARAEQRDFESVRRRHYPRDAWGDGRCHEHVGRLCLVHDRDDGWVPAPEAPEVVEARNRLLAVLDSLDEGNDPWITGQRVKYLLEAGDTVGARTTAARCPGGWECDALRAFVDHRAGRTLAAEAAFGRALAAMPAAERCAWEDLTPLLGGEDRAAYERLPCDSLERAAFADRFWHLGDPLWSRDGLERRTEHYARHVWSMLHARAASGYGLRWGEDLREITVRYGWPDAWDLAWRRVPGVRTERSIEAHRDARAQRFVARRIASDQPDWNLDDDRPRSEWAPPSGPVAAPEGSQVAAFRRGDRRVFVAAVEAGDPACGGEATALLSSGREIVAVATGTGGLLVSEPGPETASFLGIEQICGDGTAARRLRVPVREPDKWLSDLLLLEPGDELPGTLDATLPHVRRGPRARPGENLVVYWEWYGSAEPARVTLTISREDRSIWRKALEFVGLADRGIGTSGVRWSEGASEGRAQRAMEMTLPDLPDGEYSVTLQVHTARLGSVSTVRKILVVR